MRFLRGHPTPRRRLVRAVAFLACAIVAAAGLGACRDDGDPDSDDPTTTSAAVEGIDVALEPGAVTVFGVADGAVLPGEAQRAALAGAERYVQNAMVAPLARGEVGERLTELFAPALQPLIAAGGRDHTVITDDGIAEATATPSVTTSPVAIDALVAADGAPLVLVTAFRARTNAETEGGPVSVGRTVELTFELASGEWLVTAYKISTTRRGIDSPTSTTSADSEGDAA